MAVFQDAMVDITAFGEEIGEPYSKSYKAHKGMLKSAQNLAEKLKADDLLRNAFMGQVRKTCKSFPGYMVY